MKKLISFLALAILVSSCGNKMTLLKRHYTKGYYVQHNGHNTVPDLNKNAKPIYGKTYPNIIKYKSRDEIKNPELKTSRNIANEQKNKTVNLKPILTQNTVVVSGAVEKINKIHQTGKPGKREGLSGYSARGSSEVVEIILCIFIPPLAVYLHENGVGSHFWIDLLLCLLFFFPGIIYAFYICFS